MQTLIRLISKLNLRLLMPKSRKSTHIFPKLLEFETDVKNLLDEFLINEDMEALGALLHDSLILSGLVSIILIKLP